MLNVSPNCEAQVSSELIRLMHGPALPEPCVVPPEVAPETLTVAPAARAPANCRVSLRIDGARPLTFSGMPICEAALRQVVSDQCGFESSVTVKVGLFRTENDHILGHVSVTPDEGLSARPVYRAADLCSADDLSSLLDTAIEDACFGATPPERHRPGLCLGKRTIEETGLRLPHHALPTQESIQ